MEDINWLQILIQGGAVGICVLLVLIRYKTDKLYNKTMNNHLQHTYESDQLLANSLSSLSNSIADLKGVIRGCASNKLNKK